MMKIDNEPIINLLTKDILREASRYKHSIEHEYNNILKIQTTLYLMAVKGKLNGLKYLSKLHESDIYNIVSTASDFIGDNDCEKDNKLIAMVITSNIPLIVAEFSKM